MVTKISISLLVVMSIFFIGCGSDKGENRLAVQQMLDEGDYVGVISALESDADSNEDYIALGAAYMGKGGVSITNIVSAIAAGDKSDDGFANFVSAISKISTPTALTDLSQSSNYYKKITADCAMQNLSDSTRDICLYIGLSAITRSVVTIDSLAGKISAFTDNTMTDYQLKASTCAMAYALNNPDDGTCTLTEKPDVNFTIINKVYTPLVVTVNKDTTATPYHYLMTSNRKIVLTSGYCTNSDFSTRVDTYDDTTAPYSCPITQDSSLDDLTVSGMLVTTLNEGIGAIHAAITEDIQDDVDKYKCEILEGIYTESSGCTKSLNQDITEQNIINYLDAQNGF